MGPSLSSPDELAALRALARGFCHDVKALLTAASVCGAAGAEAEDAAELREALAQIGEAGESCRRRTETFGRLLAGTLVEPLPGGGVDLAAAAGAALEAIEPILRRSGAAASSALASAPAALPPDRALALALLMTLNGALLLEGREGARLSVATATEGRSATLRVEVQGCAIDAAGALERSLEEGLAGGRLFAPALAGARAIAAAAGGRASARGEGAVFTAAVALPGI